MARLRQRFGAATFRSPLRFERRLVGVTGVEPVTLRLSSACSNQLSYTPTKPFWLAEPEPGERVLPAFAIASARQPRPSLLQRAKAGGAEEIRTPDL